MNDSGPSSDSSEPVLVSRPASPHSAGAGPNTTNAPTTTTTTTTTNPGTADLGAPLTSNPSLSSTQSPAPPVKVLKDSSSETVAALQPTPANTTSGLGRPGEEERAHLAAPGKVLGGAEGVVGESFGLQPEWIVKVRRDRTSAPAGAAGGAAGAQEAATPTEETVLGPTTDSRSLAASSIEPGAATGAADDVDDVDDEGHDGAEGAGGGKGKHKWFKKVKHGISTAAASIKDKASDAGSITSSGSRGGGGGSSILGRARTRSVGQKSAVGFDVEDEEEDDDDDAAAKTTATKVVTDHEGRPVPLDVGAGAAEGTPPSSTPDGAVTRATAPSTGNASATTSVKDKILESFDAEPATTQEKFHSMFSELPEDEELIEDFRCALQRDILVQGKLYVSEHYLSFRASILGWETTLKIPWTEIVSIEKRMTAKIIPNAIEVRTLHATHSFSSFIARDASFALLVAVWKHVHPEADQLEAASRKAARAEKRRLRSLSAATSVRSAPEPMTGSDSDGESDARSEITFEDEQGHKKRHRFKHKLAALKGSIRSAGTSSSASASAGSATPASGPTEAEKVKAQALTGSGPGAGDSGHAATVYDGPEFKNVALDTVLPTSPGKAYELFFGDAAFLKAFMEGKEGLKEVDIGAWKPVNGPCEERDLTYLKPLNAPVGPKQTQCIIHDVNELRDEEAAIATLTTTKTPDVPSGDNFTTVTRTVFTWAEGGGCHVRVTTEVEWTKVNRLLRGVIERGAVDGQVGYHKDLEAAVREHIAAHPDEFAVAGSAPSATPASGEVKSTDTAAVEASSPAARPASTDRGSFLDSLVALDPVTVALVLLVVALAVSNLFTLVSLRKHAAIARQARVGHPAEVASAVERVLSQFNAAHAQRVGAGAARVGAGAGAGGASGDVAQLGEAMRGLEGHMESVLRDVGRAVGTVKELADQAEGVKGAL